MTLPPHALRFRAPVDRAPLRRGRRPTTPTVFATLAIVLTEIAASACVVGYDSRWGEAKNAQRKMASRETPKAITAPAESPPAAAHRVYRVRLRPDPHYLAQTVDADRQLRTVVDDASRVLERTIGLSLAVDGVEPWDLERDETLPAALTALARIDPGRDVDVVVGFVGALAVPTDSFHEVGYAELLGKHAVIRAASRLGEYDAYDRALASLNRDERERVVAARRRHRALAVFLHEMGHLLGALHELDPASLMHPAYDTEMTSFGPDAAALMRLSIESRDRRSLAEAQIDYLLRTRSPGCEPAERDAAIARLRAWTAPAAVKPDTPAPTDGASPPELSPEDRLRFAQAQSFLRTADVRAAYESARPLFDRYPESYAVQDLRCQLTALRFVGKEALAAECAPSIRLAAKDGGSR